MWCGAVSRMYVGGVVSRIPFCRLAWACRGLGLTECKASEEQNCTKDGKREGGGGGVDREQN